MSLEQKGLFYGLIGIVAFGLTLPVTRISIDHFGAVGIGWGRALAASIPAALILLWKKAKLPSLQQIKGLAIVAAGVVFGFPLLSAWAMEHLPASHGAVILALFPLATAGAAVLRIGERPSRRFWLASLAGSIAVLLYSMGEKWSHVQLGDLALLGAVLAAAVGYAEGGRLSQTMGGWKVICWALVLSAPILLVILPMTVSSKVLEAPLLSWWGFVYLSLVSQLFGFFAWYQGLALGGVAKISQLQYLQPFVTIVFSALFLNETITLFTVSTSLIVVFAVAAGRRSTVQRSPQTVPSPKTCEIHRSNK
ncbi:DMT family transporter [Marinithermofilum abyssi]|nr:DMT family transporter [Marinithermofilum abyssi]